MSLYPLVTRNKAIKQKVEIFCIYYNRNIVMNSLTRKNIKKTCLCLEGDRKQNLLEGLNERQLLCSQRMPDWGLNAKHRIVDQMVLENAITVLYVLGSI